VSTKFRICHALKSQSLLRDIGPMVPASFGISNEKRVKGNLLLDTGAGHVSIDESLALQLGFPVHTEQVDLHGLGGKHSVAMYEATLFLPVEMAQPDTKVPPGALVEIAMRMPIHGILGLQASLD
jgi:Aspartyl protease